ncbi:protein phosphatase 2C [Bacillus wiedmannii]|uniref:protein phosphatase 2C n=1 Tax=Bacillus cereus group TaxID=86661 RepID=UPI0011EF4999|nr:MULTISPECIES: protein phosphatase 2C [Bacillus cereus group]KAA0795171.1 protein phosphatase 2C [Bacillus sp. BB081]QWH71973.1 protein phosphatase 2C [Bacillus wiedmannii]
MLKKLKKVMFVAIAAITLSTGFATIAPKEASAHWADQEIDWAFRKGIMRNDYRDSPALRQDVWIMVSRFNGRWVKNYDEARQYMMSRGYSDGTRGGSYMTTLFAVRFNTKVWNPTTGFSKAIAWGEDFGIYTNTRGNDAVTRAEAATMLYRFNKKFR